MKIDNITSKSKRAYLKIAIGVISFLTLSFLTSLRVTFFRYGFWATVIVISIYGYCNTLILSKVFSSKEKMFNFLIKEHLLFWLVVVFSYMGLAGKGEKLDTANQWVGMTSLILLPFFYIAKLRFLAYKKNKNNGNASNF